MAIDAWYREGEVQQNLTQARELLGDEDSFEEIVRKLEDADHSKAAFDYPMDQSIAQGPRFERITRQGYLEAIALALEHTPPVPIRTYWMTGAGNDDFEMHISDEAEHVSVTLCVPKVDGGSHRRSSPEAWVVRFDAGDDVEVVQTSGHPDREQPSLRPPTTAS
jgi:hypothetical protein